MPKSVSLIILVHQEAEVIERVVAGYYDAVIAKIPGSEFIVCEDGSTDGTKDILKRIEGRYHLTLHMGNVRKGYTRAKRDAFAMAKNPVIFFSDSDGQHNPEDFWKLYRMLDKYDMVIGWKQNRKDGLTRLFITKGYNLLIGLYFGIWLHDIDCGFRVMKKEVVDYLLTKPWRMAYCVSSELAVKARYAGFRVGETKVSHFRRQSGSSRALPFLKIPGIIVGIIKKFPAIRRDITTS